MAVLCFCICFDRYLLLVLLPYYYTPHSLVRYFNMKLVCFASLVASAAAFTSTGAAFTTHSHSVGQRTANVDNGAHRTRRATIVMDGKANGTFPSTTILIVMESPFIDLEMGIIRRFLRSRT